MNQFKHLGKVLGKELQKNIMGGIYVDSSGGGSEEGGACTDLGGSCSATSDCCKGMSCLHKVCTG